MPVAITVGVGAQPLKPDYCISSNSHFNKGEAESVCACSVCVSWRHFAYSLACHVCLYSVWSQNLSQYPCIHTVVQNTNTEMIFEKMRVIIQVMRGLIARPRCVTFKPMGIWIHFVFVLCLFIHTSISSALLLYFFLLYCFVSALLQSHHQWGSLPI